jgi:site-specific DNA-methyltransferase (adenine-specific)
VKPYYQDDAVTIYHGDCREILPTISPVDLVLTDPPYNCINRATGGLRTIDKGGADSRPVEIEAAAAEFVRLATGSIYVWCGASFLSDWLRAFEDAGLTTRGGVWHKPNPSPMNGEKMWLSALEFCAFARKPSAYFDSHCKPALWRWPTEPGDHPTPKPMRLMQEQIGASCPKGGIVLDPYMGGATTLRAAKDLGRRAIGIEIEERYCEIAARRMGQEVLDFGSAA